MKKQILYVKEKFKHFIVKMFILNNSSFFYITQNTIKLFFLYYTLYIHIYIYYIHKQVYTYLMYIVKIFLENLFKYRNKGHGDITNLRLWSKY